MSFTEGGGIGRVRESDIPHDDGSQARGTDPNTVRDDGNIHIL